MKKIIAYYFHEDEFLSAQSILKNQKRTDSYIIGDIDESGESQLNSLGILYKEIPQLDFPQTALNKSKIIGLKETMIPIISKPISSLNKLINKASFIKNFAKRYAIVKNVKTENRSIIADYYTIQFDGPLLPLCLIKANQS